MPPPTLNYAPPRRLRRYNAIGPFIWSVITSAAIGYGHYLAVWYPKPVRAPGSDQAFAGLELLFGPWVFGGMLILVALPVWFFTLAYAIRAAISPKGPRAVPIIALMLLVSSGALAAYSFWKG